MNNVRRLPSLGQSHFFPGCDRSTWGGFWWRRGTRMSRPGWSQGPLVCWVYVFHSTSTGTVAEMAETGRSLYSSLLLFFSSAVTDGTRRERWENQHQNPNPI